MQSELRTYASSPWRGKWMRALLFCFLSAIAPLFGQGQYSFRSWQTEHGLPANLVRSIVQARDGHLWIATAERVARFDGVQFERIEFPGNFPYPHTGSSRLFATSDGAVWFSSSKGGLLRMLGDSVSVLFHDTDSLEAPQFTQLIDAPHGGILALRSGEIWSINGEVPKQLRTHDPEALAALRADLEQRARTGRIGPNGQPGSLEDRSSSVWSVSPDGALTVTSPEGFKRGISQQKVSPDFQVTEMLEDNEGNIWVATALNGLGLFREDRVEIVNAAAGLGEGEFLAVLEDSRGRVWLGNRRGGVDRIADGRIEHFSLGADYEKRQVSALYEDRDGRLWAASVDGPVYRWRDNQFAEHSAENLVPTEVNSIYHDHRGTIWFGGRLGLMRSSGRRVSNVGAEAGYPGGAVTAMSGGAGDELWVGTSQGFILRDVDGRMVTIATPGNLSYKPISGILVSAADQVWVTTMGAGLFLYDGSRWHHFDRAQGIPDDSLTHVVDDRLGHLWLGSSSGILRAGRSDLLARVKDPSSPVHWLRMDRSDGLPSRECIGGHHPAGWRFRDGSIWFPTNLGVVRVDPSRTMVNRTPPPVFLRGVVADGVMHKVSGGKLELAPGHTRLEFLFHGLSFSSPEKIGYRTRLVGFEDSWRDVGNQRLTTYDSVPPGGYHFEVIAMNGDGLQSPKVAMIDVVVKPRFWETKWFITQISISAILLAGGIGWLIARGRLKRRIALLKIRNTRELERARIARDLHDELGASLTEIALLADLGAEQAAGSAFQKHLDELCQKARLLGLTLDEIVWAVNPREDTLASLLDYLASFATEFLDRAGITLRMNIATGIPDLPLDANVRHSVFLAVREAFNNIVKHSEAKSAWLDASLSNNMLAIVVQDNGKGIDDYAFSRGHGLKNFQIRMDACRGEVCVSNRDGGGTAVTFTVPVLAPQNPNP